MNDILAQQLAYDFCCTKEEIESPENVFTTYFDHENRRIYRKKETYLKIAVVNNKLVVSGKEEIVKKFQEELGEKSAEWFCEFHNMNALNQLLAPFGARIYMVHPFYIAEKPTEVDTKDYEIKVFLGEEIKQFEDDERLDEAFCFEEHPKDEIGIGAYQNGELVGMAGASSDSNLMWQIGINVFEGHESKGIGSMLVSLLKNEILKRNKLPFYGTSFSHLGSQRVALSAGFKPAWVEFLCTKIEEEETMAKSKVYFTKELTPEAVVKAYQALGVKLEGKVAVKVHSGEEGNQNFLHPEFMKPAVEFVNGTVVECNTAYDGARNTSFKHKKLLQKHGWSEIFTVDLMDEEGPDDVLEIPNGHILKKNLVGKNLKNYDSMLVLSHFKGHPMGGFGGALKQLSIGCASSDGKAYIHSAGKVASQDTLWENLAEQDDFLASMADAASSVVNFFKGKTAYVSILCNLSVDCDCVAKAEAPCMKDIGIMASLDPVALDRACIDAILNADDNGKEHFMERVNSLHGLLTIEKAEELGIGTTNYERIDLDK